MPTRTQKKRAPVRGKIQKRATQPDDAKQPEGRHALRDRVAEEHGVASLLMIETSKAMSRDLDLEVTAESDPEGDGTGRVCVNVQSYSDRNPINLTGSMENNFMFECLPSALRELGDLFRAIAESVEAHHTVPPATESEQ